MVLNKVVLKIISKNKYARIARKFLEKKKQKNFCFREEAALPDTKTYFDTGILSKHRVRKTHFLINGAELTRKPFWKD